MNLPRKLWLAAWLLLMAPLAALAHPLGNSSVTHFDVLYVLPEHFEMDLVLDIAEETSRVLRATEIDADRNGDDTIEEQKAWVARKAKEYAPLLKVSLDGTAVPLQPVEEGVNEEGKKELTRLILKIPGFAEMPTYKLVIRYAGQYPIPLAAGEHTLGFEDGTFIDSPGLRRILLERVGGVEMIGARPAYRDEGEDPFIYEQYDPGNLPREKSTAFKFRLTSSVEPAAAKAEITSTDAAATGPASAALGTAPAEDLVLPPYVASLTDPRNDPSKTAVSYRNADRLIGLLRGRWGLMTLLTVTLLAFTWGAWHALMPGHAKTVVAAYLISQHGTYRHAVVLAVIVTLTHTALVVAMGLIIWGYQASHPTLGPTIQLWLGTIAGVLVAVMGGTLIWRGLAGHLHHHHDQEHTHSHEHNRSWLRRLFTHSHPHVPGSRHDHHDHEHVHGDHDHTHHHHDHDHQHEHSHSAHAVSNSVKPQDLVVGGQISTKLLVMMGVTGGIVPCPTAMIIMLLGIGTNVVPGALYAVAIFSLGLALTLMAIGFLALSSRRFAARFLLDTASDAPRTHLRRFLFLNLLPAMSGSVVFALGAAITAHYLYLMRTGLPLFTWLG